MPASNLRPLRKQPQCICKSKSTDMPRKLPLPAAAAAAECQVSEIKLLTGGVSTDGCNFLRRIRAKDTGGGDGWSRFNKQRSQAGAEQIPQIPQIAVENRRQCLFLTRSRAAPVDHGIAATVTTGTARHGSSLRPGTRSGLFPDDLRPQQFPTHVLKTRAPGLQVSCALQLTLHRFLEPLLGSGPRPRRLLLGGRPERRAAGHECWAARKLQAQGALTPSIPCQIHPLCPNKPFQSQAKDMSGLGIGECMIPSYSISCCDAQDQGWGDQGWGGGGGLACQPLGRAKPAMCHVPFGQSVLGPRSRLKGIRVGRSQHLGLELGLSSLQVSPI